jgi:hypothetical protein
MTIFRVCILSESLSVHSPRSSTKIKHSQTHFVMIVVDDVFCWPARWTCRLCTFCCEQLSADARKKIRQWRAETKKQKQL